MRVVELLRAPVNGICPVIAELALESGIQMPFLAPEHLRAENVAPELAEKSVAAKYPAVHVYCEKVSNLLREKFRTFSGKAKLVAEARVSQDRLEGLEQKSQLMADAITAVLDINRGDWGQGMFYTGGYEITYGAVKHGGKNFLQITKVTFEIDISAN